MSNPEPGKEEKYYRETPQDAQAIREHGDDAVEAIQVDQTLVRSSPPGSTIFFVPEILCWIARRGFGTVNPPALILKHFK